MDNNIEIKKVDKSFFKNMDKLGGFPDLSFSQTYIWADIQEKYGKSCIYFVFEKNEEIIGFSVFIKNEIKFFKYFYAPRGPFFKRDLDQKTKENIILLLAKEFKSYGADFLRIEPVLFDFSFNDSFSKTRDIQPARTSFLDLRKDFSDILKEMKSKTRYNIRLARRKGVEVIENTDKKTAFENFIGLIKVTSERDAFSIHKDDYYQNIIGSDSGKIKVFEAHYQGKVLASGIFSFVGDCVTYLHGASSNENRNVMAPYLLHSEIIERAMESGFSFYDFYGIDDFKWPGVSRFKKGFGGQEFVYPGTYDFKINNLKYLIYSFLRRINSFKSKFL